MQYLLRTALIIAGTLVAWTATAQDVTWEPTAVDTSLHVRSLFVATSGTIFAGTDGGLLRSTEEVDSWTTAGPAGVNDMVQLPSGVLLAAGREGVHRSTDVGETWTEVLPKPLLDECGDILQYTFVTVYADGLTLAGSIEEDAAGPCKIIGRMYRSDDDGRVWSSIRASVFDPRVARPLSLDTLLYADDGGGISFYFNVNTDQQVSKESVTLLDAPATALVISDEELIFIGTGLPLGGSGQIGLGIYRSQDGGETWQQVNTGLIDTTITDLAVYPNGTLLAATYRGGVHRSTDGGDTWLPLNRGLPSLQVTALAVTDEGTVYAGTDQGIYRSTRPIATDTKDEPALPERFHLGANYPNPFNPQTTITYALPRGTEVHLAVYDVLGREVAVLVDGTRPAGRHAAVFEAGNLPSGMYLVRLNAGEHFETRSMTLMK
jgi:photosystem II stability/assembly factor-like uncharacterized protein